MYILQTYNLNSSIEIKFNSLIKLLSYLKLTNKNHKHLITNTKSNKCFHASYNQLLQHKFNSQLSALS